MPDRLSEYRRKRDPGRTPEPVPPADQLPAGAAEPPAGPLPEGNDNTFVIQQHHARRLHWDLRLERDGVLVSWALPRGVPRDPAHNHLAVHTEDHPMEYAEFAGEIPAGEYGGGQVYIHDRGTYETEKWLDDEVVFVLHGARESGKYVLFQTKGKDWMIHRMDPPDPDRQPMPELVKPMLATLATELPGDDRRWGFELKWDGVRAVGYVSGGRLRLTSRNDRDVTATYPELRGLGEQLAPVDCVLDGEIVAFDQRGKVSFGALQPRMHVGDAAAARRLADSNPVLYLVFDLLYLNGKSTVDLPYTQRRELLESLDISGDRWQTPPYFPSAGAEALQASRDQGMEGVVCKRLTSRYQPGRRGKDWLKVRNWLAQEVVIGGWKPGAGRRAGTIGSLLLGVYSDDSADGLTYVGNVGTGFTQKMLGDLLAKLRKIERKSSPFATPLPRPDEREAHWVSPKLVGEVAFTEWTGDGRLRHPSWRGLRPDKSPPEVHRETPG